MHWDASVTDLLTTSRSNCIVCRKSTRQLNSRLPMRSVRVNERTDKMVPHLRSESELAYSGVWVVRVNRVQPASAITDEKPSIVVVDLRVRVQTPDHGKPPPPRRTLAHKAIIDPSNLIGMSSSVDMFSERQAICISLCYTQFQCNCLVEYTAPKLTVRISFAVGR